MVTKNDLILEYTLKTGKFLDKRDAEDFMSLEYCKFIENRLLEKLNEEKEREELFNQTNVIDGQ